METLSLPMPRYLYFNDPNTLREPKITLDAKVVLVRDIYINGKLSIKKGQKGVVKKLTPQHLDWLIRDYNSEIQYKIQGLPDMTVTHSFYPIKKDGSISTGHTYINQNYFKIIQNPKAQLKLNL